jgi:thiol-disulfide isomerase/thioredoxin
MLRKLGLRLTSLAICGLVTFQTALADGLVINAPAPDFTARTFDGRDVSLADYKGQVLIINFWATWCGPCKEELPLLDGYFRAADEKKYGLKVLAITTEDSLPLNDLRPLAARVSFDMARHFHGPYRALKGVPTNFIIDRNGVLRYAQSGAFTLDALNEIVIPMLQQPAPTDAPAGPTKASLTLH